jgi:hypothetical protein
MPGLLKPPTGRPGTRSGCLMKRTITGLLALLTILAISAAWAAPVTRVLAEDTQRVGLVIKFSDGSVFTDCVDYTGPDMTGEDVLDQSGLSLVKDFSYGGLGAAICKIEEDGCNYPSQNCFCQCAGSESCIYWAYYHLDQGKNKWVYSGMGASGHTVQAGDVEGWAWGAGTTVESTVKPPLRSFEQLCPAPTATPEPSPPVVEFTADPDHILAGQCSTLSWSVENAEIVALDGEGVRPEDARYLCPSQTHTYELTVLNGSGDYSYELTIEVSQPTATPRPTATPTATRSPTPGTTSSSPPSPTPTSRPVEPASSPTASPTPSPIVTDTPEATVVAMAPAATPTIASGEETDVTEPGEVAVAEVTNPITASSDPAYQETVGLDRLLLLLGVGAGTLGFGAVAFVAITALLIVIYVRARAQF